MLVKHYLLLFLTAVLVRGTVFELFIAPEQRYHQADSNDYHLCGALLTYTHGLTRMDNGEPIFWRTPGYPAYLYPFYKFLSEPYIDFEKHERTHRWAIWVQLILSSLAPLLLFGLALQITGSLFISWALALIGVFHIGFVLASTYLLTDALAALFFYLFLWALASVWLRRGTLQHNKRWAVLIIGAALALAAYTWMRPNGEFYALFVIALMLLLPAQSWADRLRKPLLFALVFFASLSPWYIRNYRATGQWFFCPMAGTYLNCFAVPKILCRLHGWSIADCCQFSHQSVGQMVTQRRQQAQAIGSTEIISPYLVVKEFAYPIIKAHPWYFLQDWVVQVVKTTFDLFSYQLAAIALNCYRWDPLEEFLTVKLHTTLLGAVPWWIKLFSWLELFFYLFVWIGIIGGFVNFVRKPWATQSVVWFVLMVLFGLFVAQTGGFGYARLRIPVEPLLLIASLMFYGQTLRPVAGTLLTRQAR